VNIRRIIWLVLFVLFCVSTMGIALGAQSGKRHVSWRQLARFVLQGYPSRIPGKKYDPSWFASDEAIRVADNVLLYHRNSGGWPSNIDMARELTEEQKERIRDDKDKNDALLDNSATHTQVRYLAIVYNVTKLERFEWAFYKGLDYILDAQYDNGGWPQVHPSPRGYHKFITFNDDAMIGALSLVRDIAERKFDYEFVDEQHRKRAEAAVKKGIECILKCQIIVDGKRTAWCQQHDEKTFEPRYARTFEPIAITTCESVGIVEFLMSIDKPSPEIIGAVRDAVDWLESVKITGIRQIRKFSTGGERRLDRVIVEDEKAKPMWARLYQIGTNRPIFGDRDGKVYYAMSDISIERREGYAWYGYWPQKLLEKDYPTWREKWIPSTY
jgi:PelA/Pel-15E family pectate lyase